MITPKERQHGYLVDQLRDAGFTLARPGNHAVYRHADGRTCFLPVRERNALLSHGVAYNILKIIRMKSPGPLTWRKPHL